MCRLRSLDYNRELKEYLINPPEVILDHFHRHFPLLVWFSITLPGDHCEINALGNSLSANGATVRLYDKDGVLAVQW